MDAATYSVAFVVVAVFISLVIILNYSSVEEEKMKKRKQEKLKWKRCLAT